MKKAMSSYGEIELAFIPSKYPRGGEKQLIEVVLGREVPPPSGLPLNVGVIVSNVGTAYAYGANAQDRASPGREDCHGYGEGITRPTNFRALIGTPVSYLIEKAGGFKVLRAR